MLSKQPWFNSRYPTLGSRGWNWRPVSWEGWAITVGAVAAAWTADHFLDRHTTAGTCAIIGVIAVLAFVSYLTGKSPDDIHD